MEHTGIICYLLLEEGLIIFIGLQIIQDAVNEFGAILLATEGLPNPLECHLQVPIMYLIENVIRVVGVYTLLTRILHHGFLVILIPEVSSELVLLERFHLLEIFFGVLHVHPHRVHHLSQSDNLEQQCPPE